MGAPLATTTARAAWLAQVPAFAGLSAEARRALAALAELAELACGATLYSEGGPADYFYILVSGRLRVTRDGILIGYLGRCDAVGEIGVLAGDPRESTIHAVRESRLLRFPADGFLAFLATRSDSLLALTRMLIRRLRQNQRTRRRIATETQNCFALLPASPAVPVTTLAEALVNQLGGWPHARLITAAHVDATFGAGFAHRALSDAAARARLLAWCDKLEASHDYLLFAAADPDSGWGRCCARLADRIVALAEADSEPRVIPALAALGEAPAPVELLLLRSEGDPSPHTLAWLERTASRGHYFVHPWEQSDLAALARQLTGRGIGLVLGGGGARGFAHIGLLRALGELDIPVDIIGGTSMGAFIGGLAASGFDTLQMTQIARETFVNNNYLNDYTLPRVSLIRARRFRRRLFEIFGERRIEDLRRTFFAVSTNLTAGAAMIHDRGRLADGVGISMAVPGVAPPIAYQGNFLCDGGVIDNLPTDVMQSLERGCILASSVSAQTDMRAPDSGLADPDPDALFNWKGPLTRPGFSEILLRTATLTSDTLIQREAVERADVLVRMPVGDYGMFDWRRLDELIDRGYEHALAQLTPLRGQLLSQQPIS